MSIDWAYELGVASVSGTEALRNLGKAQDTSEAGPRTAFLLVAKRHVDRLAQQLATLTAPEPEAKPAGITTLGELYRNADTVTIDGQAFSPEAQAKLADAIDKTEQPTKARRPRAKKAQEAAGDE